MNVNNLNNLKVDNGQNQIPIENIKKKGKTDAFHVEISPDLTSEKYKTATSGDFFQKVLHSQDRLEIEDAESFPPKFAQIKPQAISEDDVQIGDIVVEESEDVEEDIEVEEEVDDFELNFGAKDEVIEQKNEASIEMNEASVEMDEASVEIYEASVEMDEASKTKDQAVNENLENLTHRIENVSKECAIAKQVSAEETAKSSAELQVEIKKSDKDEYASMLHSVNAIVFDEVFEKHSIDKLGDAELKQLSDIVKQENPQTKEHFYDIFEKFLKDQANAGKITRNGVKLTPDEFNELLGHFKSGFDAFYAANIHPLVLQNQKDLQNTDVSSAQEKREEKTEPRDRSDDASIKAADKTSVESFGIKDKKLSKNFLEKFLAQITSILRKEGRDEKDERDMRILAKEILRYIIKSGILKGEILKFEVGKEQLNFTLSREVSNKEKVSVKVLTLIPTFIGRKMDLETVFQLLPGRYQFRNLKF